MSLSGTIHNSIQLPENYPTARQKYTSCRWRLSYLLTFAFALVMILRNCMSFAIVCMTGEVTSAKEENSTGHCNSTFNVSDTVHHGEFNYSSQTQGLLISSPFYAAIIAPVAGSFCSHKIGPQRFMFIFMLISGVVTILTPLAARRHLFLFVTCRVIVGFVVNAILPAPFDLWLNWAPAQEKSQLVSYTFLDKSVLASLAPRLYCTGIRMLIAGFSVALVILYSVSGFICLIPFDNGWPFIFYIFGGCTIVWCGLWYFTVHESPETHPGITEAEKIYIVRNRTIQTKRKRTIPWKHMLLSKPVWAYFIVFFCHAWNNGVLFGYLPLYMATVLNFDVKQNGLLSSLPYISRSFATVFLGYLNVRLTRVISVTKTRKLIQTTGFVVAAALAVGLCYVEEGQEYMAVTIFIIYTPFQIVTVSSAILTPVDMAPQYASIITSIGMVFSFAALMLAPLVVSFILIEKTRQQWSMVFYSMAGVYVFATLMFLFFGSAELQPWAEETTEITGTPVGNSDATIDEALEDTENDTRVTNAIIAPEKREKSVAVSIDKTVKTDKPMTNKKGQYNATYIPDTDSVTYM